MTIQVIKNQLVRKGNRINVVIRVQTFPEVCSLRNRGRYLRVIGAVTNDSVPLNA